MRGHGLADPVGQVREGHALAQRGGGVGALGGEDAPALEGDDEARQRLQTVAVLDGKTSMPLSERYYLADAVFLAGIEGDRALLEGLDEALRHPFFPLYLGRRSCPPTHPVSMGLRETGLLDALRAEPWLAAQWFRKQHRHDPFDAELLLDQEVVQEAALPAQERGAVRGSRDVPASFDPRRRDYGFRQVERLTARVSAPEPDPHDPMAELSADDHDPMAELEEANPCS